MLRIQPIDNRSNISFNGVFVKNKLLDKTIEYANNSELIRFREHLKVMAQTSDNRVFTLSKFVTEDFWGKNQSLKLSEKSPQSNNSFIVGTELNIKDTNFGDNCYINALKKINDFMNSFYRITDPVSSRGTLIKTIESYLKSQ
ncbi:MAG: hypothetical protein MJ231_07250 [bacterium]|nr:hypothetical protein [bacterium]